MRGIERGIERAIGPVRTVAYVEIEAFIIENLVRQMESGVLASAPVFSDVKTFADIAHHFRNKVHGITAGYPCQPFSHAGDRAGTDDLRHLFPFIYRIMQAVKPVWGFFENVTGHISLGYDEVYRSLRDLGYTVEAGIFSAVEAGAPHQRERLFIFAILSDTLHSIRKTGTERTGWKTWTNINWSSAESELGNSNNGSLIDFSGRYEKHSREEGIQERNTIQESGKSNGMAHTASAEQQECGPGELGQFHEQDGKRQSGFEQSGIHVSHAKATESYGHLGGEKECAGSANIRPAQNVSNTYDGCSERANGQIQAGRNVFKHIHPKLGDTTFIGIQRNRTEGQRFSKIPTGQNVSGRTGRRTPTRFVAPPGSEQYDWEAPRVIPSLGCTVNGYNFREDLLRMLGNGVVEQSAEIAFPTLLKKLLTIHKP